MEGWQLWLMEQAQHYGQRVLAAVLLVLLGGLLLRYLLGPLRRLLTRSRLDPASISFLLGSLRTLIVLAVVLALLHQFGVETTSLLTLLGAAGLAVALSLQSSLTNFAAGLLVLAFRMVRIGDLIEVGDVRGRVCEMLPFHIVLETVDNQRITLPNTLLTTGPVRNNTALPTRRVEWVLPLTPRDDLAAVKAALRQRLLADERVLPEPAPLLYVQSWADDRRVLAIAAWTPTGLYVAVQQEMLEELGKTLEATRAAHAASLRAE